MIEPETSCTVYTELIVKMYKEVTGLRASDPYISAGRSRWQRFSTAYNDAMTSVRSARSQSVAAEHRFNFHKRRSSSTSTNGKKQKVSNGWTHTFFCLANTDQEKLFTMPVQKNELVMAGLGEKKSLYLTSVVTQKSFMKKLWILFQN